MLPGSNSLFQLRLLYWAFQSVNISVAGFYSSFSLTFAFTSLLFYNNICVPMQGTRCYWWRSNQALYPYYIGFWSRIFRACHKGKHLYWISLFRYFQLCGHIIWQTWTVTFCALHSYVSSPVLKSFWSCRCILKGECPIISARWKLVIICPWRDLRWSSCCELLM